jgi:hypothetical protein
VAIFTLNDADIFSKGLAKTVELETRLVYPGGSGIPGDIVTRAFQVRAESVNAEERSVEAVIASEAPVMVWDWRSGDVIDEVLLMSGAAVPPQGCLGPAPSGSSRSGPEAVRMGGAAAIWSCCPTAIVWRCSAATCSNW